MRFIILVYLLLFCSIIGNCQDALKFSGVVIADSTIGTGGKAKITKDLKNWFDGYSKFKDLLNDKIDTITGKGHFPYMNPVVFQGSESLSKSFADQTNGLFVYSITFYVTDKGYRYVLSNFTHYPGKKTDKIDFGLITTEKDIPATIKCDVDSKWCNEVWDDMKRQISGKATLIIGTLPYK